MKKTAKDFLSDVSGYSVDELKDRCTEILIQPWDAELAAEAYAAHRIAEREKEIREFLFNMHDVENNKAAFKLSDLIRMFPPVKTWTFEPNCRLLMYPL